MEKHLLEELKKIAESEAQTTAEKILVAILLDVYERENKVKDD